MVDENRGMPYLPPTYFKLSSEEVIFMADQVPPVTDGGFQKDVLSSDKPTLVDFWASWCAPCRAIAPLVDELATKYTGKVNFRKLNIDENPSTPIQYGVKGIPTLILFKNGQILDQVIGAVPKDRLEALVQKAL